MKYKTTSIEDVRTFIADVEKKRSNWLLVAERSWAEIKKRNKRNRLWGGDNLDKARRWVKFPLWYSAFEIRKPIVLSRLPLPILKDTQGDDPYGRTACILGERLTKGILKTFEALPVLYSGRDDFLVTNFGWNRWFYKSEEKQEEELIRLQQIEQPAPEQQDPNAQPLPPMPPLFVTPDGQVVDAPMFDDLGPYVLTGKMIDVQDEQVYMDSGLYTDLLVDPDALRWYQVKRLAFRYEYSYRDFCAKFGDDALKKLITTDIDDHKSGKPIVVYEYWDYYTREVKWLSESCEHFFYPGDMPQQSSGYAPTGEMEGVTDLDGADEERAESGDIYGLSDFFPCAPPLCINAPTDEFWPIPEYFQVQDILEDVHNITTRMFLLTKAIRVRFLFDGSIPELKSLINETGEGGGISVPNLAASLMNGQGTLAALVAYFPVSEMIEGLSNMYMAFSQRLDMFYQATGLNDLIRGATSDVEKTYGERQMEGKFAMNRMEPYQVQIQNWIKNNYQIGMEMALKNFSDRSIDEYITPQTLDREDKQRYEGALRLLKSNRRNRFRFEFETDSTISINQQFQKQQAIDLANTLTKAMESVATVAETQPELAAAELSVLKHLIGEFTNGKLFIDEIQDSIQSVIEKVNQPKPPQPDYEMEKLRFEGAKAGSESQFKQLELQTQTEIEWAKLQQRNQQDSFKNQLEQIRLNIEAGTSQSNTQIAITKLQAEIAQGWEDLNIKKETLLSNIQSEIGKKEMEQMRVILDARVKNQELSLAEANQQLEVFRTQLEAQDHKSSLDERWATEHRLQAEHSGNMEAKQIGSIATLANAMKQEQPKAAPISVDLSKTLQVKSPAAPKGRGKK